MSSSSLSVTPQDLPPEVASYLISQALKNRSMAYLQVTLEGKIIRSGGELSTYGLKAAKNGDSISEQLFYLDGFFPHSARHEVLPSIQTKPGQTIDIHFVPVGDHQRTVEDTPQASDKLWILLMDSSLETRAQQKLQQTANDLSLLQQVHESQRKSWQKRDQKKRDQKKRDSTKQAPSSSSQLLDNISLINTFTAHPYQPMESQLLEQIFAALEILPLELTTDGKLQIIGQVPSWVRQDFSQLCSEDSAFEAELLSSFLSNFLIDAAAFWSDESSRETSEKTSAQTLRSGIWTETGRSGKEVNLEAIALHLEQRKIILIESSELVISEKVKLLQTVREEQLSVAYRQKETEEKIFNATFYDTLTGLPNRNLFTSQLETFFEESQWKRDRFFAVVVINIDRFKALNNSLGTKAGDQVLITVANRICECLRKPDIPVRFGSDEFGILLSHVEAQQDVTSIVGRILETISQPFLIDGHKTNFTASAGIALSEDWYQNSRDLLRDASLALQQAKSRGRGHYAIFNREMRLQAFELWNLESALRTTIEREQLQLCYQPIIDLGTQRIQRFEALVRWEHPTQGWIAPSRFIPLAEESGLIVDLDSWVFKTACETIHQWQTSTGQTAQINVNVSARHFTEGDLLDSMRRAMLPAQIPPNALCLEITESSLLDDPQSVVTTLNQLKALGINIAIDDFGTGYASLSYLQDLPLDVLKIDGYFIKMMENSSSEIVKTIIGLGHNLGLSVTAEQVETLSQYRELRRLGCDTVQGYLLSQPVPLVDAQNLLNAEVIVSR